MLLSTACFNEAAGIHRRKLCRNETVASSTHRCFNEAAGIHRRKHTAGGRGGDLAVDASMRPPEFTGGNGPQPTPGDSYSC